MNCLFILDPLEVLDPQWDTSLALLRELAEVTDLVLQQEADRDEDFRVILASQTAFRREYDAWKQLAYLPRDFSWSGQ